MSAYENVVAGKLKLKGKALDIKAGCITKRKKHKKLYHQISEVAGTDLSKGGSVGLSTNSTGDVSVTGNLIEGHAATYGRLTPAEKRYLQQWEKIELRRLAKSAGKSHRDRVQEFNQYLANLTEHYDIPKVGPG